MTRFEPSSPEAIVELAVAQIARRHGRVVVAVDGADAAEPADLAASIAARLRTEGRAAEVIRLAHYLRPASLRLEYGHTDPHSYRTGWFDLAALDREVVSALRTDGHWLPRLWDADRDRSFRDARRPAAPDQVLLVAGPMLLGRDLDFDLTIRLQMSAAALSRRTPPAQHWTIEPLLAHAARCGVANIDVRYDHPARPAVARSGS